MILVEVEAAEETTVGLRCRTSQAAEAAVMAVVATAAEEEAVAVVVERATIHIIERTFFCTQTSKILINNLVEK